jgi:hypothetical protein
MIDISNCFVPLHLLHVLIAARSRRIPEINQANSYAVVDDYGSFTYLGTRFMNTCRAEMNTYVTVGRRG